MSFGKRHQVGCGGVDRRHAVREQKPIVQVLVFDVGEPTAIRRRRDLKKATGAIRLDDIGNLEGGERATNDVSSSRCRRAGRSADDVRDLDDADRAIEQRGAP